MPSGDWRNLKSRHCGSSSAAPPGVSDSATHSRQRHERLGGAETARHHADVAVLARIDAGAGLARAVAVTAPHVAMDRPLGDRVLEREGDAFLTGHVEPLAPRRSACARRRAASAATAPKIPAASMRLLALDGERLGVAIAAERQEAAGGQHASGRWRG